MKKSIYSLAMFFAASMTLDSSASAAMQTVTLDVSGMYCSVCPITVKKSLEKVTGVSNVKVSFEAKEAAVTYDDAKTSVKQLVDATSNAGYPSNVKEPKKK